MSAGMSAAVQEERLPYIKFEARNQKYMDPQGNPIFKDEDWVVIYSSGGKDMTEKLVKDWIATLDQHLISKRITPEYLRQVKEAYKEFQAGRELPINGTPLEALGLTTQQLKMLSELHIRAVEDLAQCPEDVVLRMGMGGRALKGRAQVFVQSMAGPAQVANQLTAMRIKEESQRAQIAQLEKQLAAARMELGEMRSQAAAAPVFREADLRDPAERLAEMRGADSDDKLVDATLGE